MVRDEDLDAQLEAINDGSGWCDVGDLTVFRVTGEQARETLQRVVSQDVSSLSEGRSSLALVLKAKGQCRALMAVLALDGGLLLAAPPGRGDALRGTLEKYLLLSRCRLDEMSRRALVVIGREWATALDGLGLDPARIAADGVVSAGDGPTRLMGFPAGLLGVEGAVVIAQGDEVQSASRERLSAAGSLPVTAEAIELERLRNGFPAWGAEVVEEFLPQEIGLDKVAVSTRKGCYIGQETMARLETYGHPNRRLVGFHEIGGREVLPELPGDLLPDGEERPRGTLTSWARHPEIGGVALGVVRRQHAEPGTVFSVGPRRFRVSPFPLW